MPGSRPIRLPAVNFEQRELPFKMVSRLDVLRVHGLHRPALQFRRNAAHRFSHPDAEGGLLYMSPDLETCLWECFGDTILDSGSMISRAAWENRCLSRIVCAEVLKICDLTNLAVRRKLGLDLSALKHPDLVVPQAWGMAIQNHPERVDGIRYSSRFTAKPCMVVFERSGRQVRLTEEGLGALPELDGASEFLEEHSIALV